MRGGHGGPPLRLRIALVRLTCGRRLFHLLPQAQWPHVNPYFLYVRKTFRLWADLAGILPAFRVFSIGGPDRVLFFMIDHYSINRGVFSIGVVRTHDLS